HGVRVRSGAVAARCHERRQFPLAHPGAAAGGRGRAVRSGRRAGGACGRDRAGLARAEGRDALRQAERGRDRQRRAATAHSHRRAHAARCAMAEAGLGRRAAARLRSRGAGTLRHRDPRAGAGRGTVASNQLHCRSSRRRRWAGRRRDAPKRAPSAAASSVHNAPADQKRGSGNGIAGVRFVIERIFAVSNAKAIVALLRSRAEGDDDAFFSIALQIAAAEARQGRRTTAEELRTEVEKARARESRGASVPIPFAHPRGSLEGLLEMRDPRYKLKDVVLNERLVSRFDDILRQQRRRDWLREHGKTPSRRLLFVGPSGSGKTMSAEAVAGELHLPLFIIRLEGLITRYMGETAGKLRVIFDETIKRRGVYLFDEF